MKNTIKFKSNLREWETKEQGILNFPETADEFTKRARRHCSLVGDRKSFLNHLKTNRQYSLCVQPRMDSYTFWESAHRAVME